MLTTARGAPYPEASDANDYPGRMHDLATWANDRPGIATLTTTQRNALSGAELWAGRHIWNSTTGRLEFYNGTLWLPTPMPGRILGSVFDTTHTGTTTSLSDADVDTTHLAVTFTAPASGSVWVELEGVIFAITGGSSGNGYYWSVRNGTTTLGQTIVASVAAGPTTIETPRCRATFNVTGLTPGTVYTFKWGHFLTVGTPGSASTGGSTNAPAVMRILEA